MKWKFMKKMADRKLSGIPKAYRIFEENGEVYLVREYIEGMSLAQMVLQKGGISEAEICRISRKICQTAEQFQNPDEPHDTPGYKTGEYSGHTWW